MDKRYSCVLFDLDGTLTDPYEGITRSVAFALARFGIEVEDRRALSYFIGPPLRESFKNYDGIGAERAEEAVEAYREYFSSRGIFENRLYDGVTEMLASLKDKGVRILLATSKPEVFAKRITEHFRVDGYFYDQCGADLGAKYDTKGKVIARALKICGMPHSEVLMVGDRLHDIVGAKENGIDSAGVLWGYSSGDELSAAGAEYVFESMEEFSRAILDLTHAPKN